MPFLAGGAGILLMLLCVVHCVRNGNTQPWLFIIILLPGVGSLAYLVAVIVPDLWHGHDGAAIRRGFKKITDPDAEMRRARRDADMVGSADAKRKLAEEHVTRGNYAAAIDMYRAALTGMHKDDPALLYGLAKTQLAAGDGKGAQASLDALQAANPNFASADAHMIYARALEAQGKDGEAQAEYEKLVKYFPGEEARCRYGLLLKRAGHSERAANVFHEVLRSVDGAPRHYVRAQREWVGIAKANAAG